MPVIVTSQTPLQFTLFACISKSVLFGGCCIELYLFERFLIRLFIVILGTGYYDEPEY